MSVSNELRRRSVVASGGEQPPPACEQCIYWEAFVEGLGGNYGFCRRHAPPAVTIAKAAEHEARWPLTEESEWCGEYRPHSPQLTSR